MPSKLIPAAALAMSLGLCACSTPALREADEVITSDFAIGGGTWSSGGGITAVGKIFNRDGGVVACGAWMTDRQSALSVLRNEDVMNAGALFVGPDRVVSNLRFLRRYEESARLAGRSAACIDTGKMWQASFETAETSLRFPRMSFSGGARSGGIGARRVGIGTGDSVTFRQEARPVPW